MRRGTAELPLHGGAAPPWLFKRMKKLAGAITMAVVDEYGPEEMLRRLADPWWFQAFGCVLGFDWHSSGLTTVTCGAMKEAARELGKDLGIFVAGGKGSTSRRTPQEIAEAADRHALPAAGRLIHASRLAAKVDSAAVQDGFQLYHHSFFFAPSGAWCVVQQGMNPASRSARRYHWLAERLRDFVCEPHNAISTLTGADEPESTPKAGTGASPRQSRLPLLNMVAAEAEANRRASAELALLEMIKSGTTGFIECMLAERYGFDGVADAILKSGVRAAIGKIVMDRPSYAGEEFVMHPGMIEDGDTSIRNTLLAYDRWNGAGDGRIQVWFGPRTPGGVSPELYDRIGKLARERNMGITVHLCEVKYDLQYAKSLGFRSPIDYASSRGLLGIRSAVGEPASAGRTGRGPQ